MRQMVVSCCVCGRVRDDVGAEPDEGVWQDSRIYMTKHMLHPRDVMFSHGYCQNCLAYYRAFLIRSEEVTARLEKKTEA